MKPEEREDEELLALLGLAVLFAQALEYNLVSLFAATEFRDNASGTFPDLQNLMDTRYTQTLGKLVRDAAAHLELSDAVADELETALRERNWLIHCFYHDFAPAAFDADLKKRAKDKLTSLFELFDKASQTIHNEVVERTIAGGIPRDQLESGIKRVTQEYIEEKLAE